MVKLVLIVLICGFLCVYLKEINSNLFTLALLSSGLIVLLFSFSYLGKFFDVINELIELSKIDKDLFKIIIKITSIGYLVEFCAGTIEDMGLKSLSDKLVFAGKIVIILTAMPIIYAVFNVLKGLLT